jgi:hypothetical protein
MFVIFLQPKLKLVLMQNRILILLLSFKRSLRGICLGFIALKPAVIVLFGYAIILIRKATLLSILDIPAPTIFQLGKNKFDRV